MGGSWVIGEREGKLAVQLSLEENRRAMQIFFGSQARSHENPVKIH